MRLIDIESAKLLAEEYYPFVEGCAEVGDVKYFLDCCPTIEAKPVVHAHWEEVREGRHICSNCKVKASLTSDEYDYMEDLSDYCSRCGAQMDELVSNTNKLNSSEKPNNSKDVIYGATNLPCCECMPCCGSRMDEVTE